MGVGGPVGLVVGGVFTVVGGLMTVLGGGPSANEKILEGIE